MSNAKTAQMIEEAMRINAAALGRAHADMMGKVALRLEQQINELHNEIAELKQAIAPVADPPQGEGTGSAP